MGPAGREGFTRRRHSDPGGGLQLTGSLCGTQQWSKEPVTQKVWRVGARWGVTERGRPERQDQMPRRSWQLVWSQLNPG